LSFGVGLQVSRLEFGLVYSPDGVTATPETFRSPGIRKAAIVQDRFVSQRFEELNEITPLLA